MTSVAVIGAGNWGKNLVRCFADLGVLSAIAEPNQTIREQMAEQYSHIPIFESHQSVLESDIPAVVIATPAETHRNIAMAAIEAGKDVFVEKPMTLSTKEAQELHLAAVNNQRVLMVGHLLLYQPAIHFIRSYLQQGKLGQIYSLHQSRLKLGRVRSHENVLWSFGVHDVALLLHLVKDIPDKVSVVGQCSLQQKIEDDIHLHMSFPGGVHAHLHTSWLWPDTVRKLTIVGAKGMLVYDELQQVVTLHQKWVDEGLAHHDEGSEILFHSKEEPLRYECLHFLECVKNRSTPISDGANGTAVVGVLEKAEQFLKARANE